MQKYLLVLIIGILFICFVPFVYASTQTLYYRYDGVLGIEDPSGSNQQDLGVTGTEHPDDASHKWNSDVYIVHTDGSETLIGSAVAEYATAAEYAIHGNGQNWNCPSINLAPTDKLRIREHVYLIVTSPAYTETKSESWITEPLGATQLESCVWTFNRIVCSSMGSGLIGTAFLYNRGESASEGDSYIAGIRCNSYIDIGIRIYDGDSSFIVACEPRGTLTSPLRIYKDGNIYGIVLVDLLDFYASKIQVKTSSGIKALRRLF